jgi:hypothetical protein
VSAIDTVPQDGYSNSQFPGVSEGVLAVIRDYQPRMPPAYWAPIRSFVIDAVISSGAPNPKWALDTMSFIARFVSWANQTAAVPLTNRAMFQPAVIDRFVLAHQNGSQRTRQLAEARLRLIAATLGSDDRPRRVPVAHNDVRPYDTSELPALFSWARQQSKPLSRRSALAMLGFCGGAGLRGRELADVRGGDTEDTDDGLLVTIRGTHPRIIAVRAGWESTVRRAINGVDADEYVALPHVMEKNRLRTLANFGRRTEGTPPRAARLRTTWVVHHLDVLAFGDLVKAGGFSTAASLERYVVLARISEPTELYRLLRGTSTP